MLELGETQGAQDFAPNCGLAFWDPSFPNPLCPISCDSHSPTDCIVATRLPAATPPPLATAAADIILAAMEEAAIPVPVKPAAPRTTGTAVTATTVETESGLAPEKGLGCPDLPWGYEELTGFL